MNTVILKAKKIDLGKLKLIEARLARKGIKVVLIVKG